MKQKKVVHNFEPVSLTLQKHCKRVACTLVG